MSATTEQQLTDLHRANQALQKERDAALAQLRTNAVVLAQRNSEYSERIAHQSAITDVLKAMSASPGDPQPIFDLIVQRARDLCDAYGATVYEFDGALIHYRAATGVSDDAAIREQVAAMYPMPATRTSAAGRAILDHRIISIDDLATEPGLHPILRRQTAKSAVILPLLRGDEAMGALAMGSRERGGFSDSQVALLQTFAEQAVIAITSSKTYRELQVRTAELAERNDAYGERIEQQAATIDVLKAMSASPGDPQPAFELIARQAARLCDAPTAAVATFDGTLVHLATQSGMNPAYSAQFPRPVGRDFAMGRAILDRRIDQVEDIATHPGHSFTDVLGHWSVMAVPMLRDDAPLGAITIGRPVMGPFSDSQVALLRTFAEQAVIAVTSAETYRALQIRTSDLEESLKYQTATSDVLSVISRSAFDLQPVLESLVTTAANLCDAEMAAIIRCEGSLFRLMASRGFPAEFIADRYARGPMQARAATVTGRAARERRVIHIHDVAAEPNYPEDSIAIGKQRSSLGVPLLREGDVVGVILLSRQRVEPFTDRQIDLVRTFADQAVIAMENARLLDELHQRSTDLQESLDYQTAISDVLRVISSSTFNLQPVFGTVAATAVRLCHAHQAGIYLRHDGEYRWAGGFSQLPDYEKIEREVRIEPGNGTLVGRVALEGRAVQIRDAWTDPLYAAKEDARIGAIHTLLGVPLLRDGHTVGVIGIGRQRVEPFSERQIELVSTFADQAVIAIENARLLGELREALEQQTATAEILQVINASPGNLAPVFDAVLEKALRLSNSTFGILCTYDGEVFNSVAMQGTEPALTQFLQAPLRPRTGGTLDRIVQGEDVVQVADITDDDAYRSDSPNRKALADLGGGRTQLLVALRSDEKLLGTFVIFRQEVRPFSTEQVGLLKSFAAQAVIAMENARLLTEQREALEQQTAVADVLQVINASPGDLGPVFDVILEKAVSLCEASLGVLHRYDGGVMLPLAARGPSGMTDSVLQTPLNVDRGTAVERLLHGEEVVHIADITDTDAYRAGIPSRLKLVEMTGARTALWLALRKDASFIGTLVIYRTEVRPFSAKEIALVENFAAQAVIAMENARLLDELHARTAELARRNSQYGERIEHQAATIDVLKAMSNSPDNTQPVFDLITRRAQELCNSKAAGIFEYDGELVHMTSVYGAADIVGAEDFTRAFPMKPTRGSIACRAILDKQTIHIRDMQAEQELLPIVRALGIRSNLAIPLLRDGEAVGVFNVNSLDPGGFSDSQVSLVQTFAEQAVIAMTSVANFRALRERTAELTRSVGELQALEEVLRAVNSSLDLDTVLATIISRAVQLSNADEGTIYEFDDAQGVFVPKSGYGMSADWLAQLRDRRIRIGETPLGRSAASRAPLHIPNLQDEPDDGSKQELLARGVRAMLAVPLLREDKVIGGLVIRRYTAGGFGPSTATLLQTFAGQCVLAIENARLFRDAERERAAAETALADLRRAQDRLVQSEKMASLGQLTAGIAHEIKNSLNFVNNFAELSVDLLDELHDAMTSNLATESEEIATLLKSNLARIAEHGRRADSIVKNMLLHSRSGPSEHRLIDLNIVVEEALNLAYHGARAETPGFNITVERQLDPAAGRIEMFPQDFTRVMLNLIANGFYAARQRASRNGISTFEPTLTLTTRDQGDQVEVRVRDNGTGIPADVRDKIFEPFFTTKPAGEGTGLGLSLSYDIVVKQHGGQLTVDSESNEFTEFRVVLPRQLATNEGART